MNKWNTGPVYPVDGNAFAIMGAAQSAMRKAGAGKADIDAYLKDATSGDYDHLLRVTTEAVDLRAGREPVDYDEYEQPECPECGYNTDSEGYCEECDEYTA